MALQNLLRGIESHQVATIIGFRYFQRGNLSHIEYEHFIRHETIGCELVKESLRYIFSVENQYLNLGHILSKDSNTERYTSTNY